MLRLTILTEGYKHTGYGHIVRCSAVARAFSELGVEIRFLLNGDKSAAELLKPFSVVLLNWIEDKERLSGFLSDSNLVLIDSYLAPEELYKFVASKIETSIYLDDFVRLNYPPGIIVNGTVGAHLSDYHLQAKHILLVGEKYAILREAFLDVQPRFTISEQIHTILITFGGSDPQNMTREILPLLTHLYPHAKKRVVVGAAFTGVEELKSLADHQTEFHFNVDAAQMRDLMCTADIAITAAGQTLNELGRTGLPSIVFKVADNQKNNIKGWLETGFISAYIDATEEWSSDNLVALLKTLEPAEVRLAYAKAGQSAMDGNGAMRIAKACLSTYYKDKIQITDAKEEDILFLFNLANDEEVRKQSFSTKPITLDEHAKWFRSVLADPHRLLYVLTVANQFMGQIRFDLSGDTAVISISISREFRGLGFAPELLALSLDRLKKQTFGQVKEVFAYVKPQNVASQRIFLKANFLPCACEKEETLKFRYRL